MLQNFSFFKIIFNDAPQAWQLGFQDSAAPGYTGIVELHNTMIFYLIVISIAVFWVLFSIINNYNYKKAPFIYKYMNHGTMLETVWTILPALLLMAIAFPSFRLLYLLDEVMSPTITMKMVGNQWYWSVEYSDYTIDNENSMDFDAYLMPESDLEVGQFSLLDVDNSITVPVNCHVSIMVTASDVLHSFAVPSLGMKMDATPGRLNQASFIAESMGTFYGQCSEICGVWHGLNFAWVHFS